MSKSQLLPVDRFRARFAVHNKFHACLLAEFFGTFMLLFLVTGVGAQFLLTGAKLNSWANVNIGVGFSIAMCVYATYTTSGAHLNPAVSLAVLSLGLLSVPHFFAYCVVQTLGAFLGVALSYFVYFDQITHFTGGVKLVVGQNATAGLFCSFPEAHVSNFSCFVDQIVGTFILLFFICAVIDPRNHVPSFLHPLFFGFILVVIGNSYGMNVGYPINPARDFGPRVFAYLAGYGSGVFTYHDYYFWIPIVAPLIGGPLGVWTYQAFIGAHMKDPLIDDPRGEEAGNLPSKIVLQNGGADELKPLSEE